MAQQKEKFYSIWGRKEDEGKGIQGENKCYKMLSCCQLMNIVEGHTDVYYTILFNFLSFIIPPQTLNNEEAIHYALILEMSTLMIL